MLLEHFTEPEVATKEILSLPAVFLANASTSTSPSLSAVRVTLDTRLPSWRTTNVHCEPGLTPSTLASIS